ncbi:hypothetical protein Oweho_0934 [Owenweeksia hongkongensis DSM 17368]|uniref:DUF4476 domain-containing protein n=1 Tax=Owenweeksia hongkongensis (strain DSM 17368 / CIP 108786 / JCM 12287 / NRRL B-23963 / UST20020801) TaxID=926562 RepID=G8R3C3_OWEHD|nr:hypothetical protein Oweho_0934 [Owenweeksia hongkongensis DSM 17368]
MLQLKKIFSVILFVFLTSPILLAQQLSGIVIDDASKEQIPGTHVINKRTLKGTLTNANGTFSINLNFGDTVIFSNIAYQYFYFIYSDSTSPIKDVVIELKEQNYLLSDVSIFSYKLTTNKDREMEIKAPKTPSNKDLSDGRITNATVANPAEYLYNLFGSKPRQLRMLAQLKAEDYYREVLEQNSNRQSVTKLTGLSKEDLEAFMFYCKYSTARMYTMNDYEFLRSVQRCYQVYVNERELEGFLEQFD